MKNLFELRRLSKKFYEDFPHKLFPEIEAKSKRPYIVLLIEIDRIKFAIPLRSNIRHSYCYKFKTSDRKTDSKTGIDFTKAVVIMKPEYIGEKADINDKEYLELQKKVFFIISKFRKYVKDYKVFRIIGGNKYIAKKYTFSTLKYFDQYIFK